MDNGSTAQYKYDHQNQRVTKIVGSSWTHYIWEGGQVIGEHDATTAYTSSPLYQEKSARLDYIYARGRMIYTRQRASSTAPWTGRYYVSDLWGTRLVLDSSGNVLGRQAHLAFGEEFAGSGTQEKHHFTTYESETETSTDYAVNRQYSQSVGRFNSADPYKASSYLVNPQSWNRYSYVLNEPIHNVDPLGLWEAIPAEIEVDPCSVAPEMTEPGPGEPPAPSCTINVEGKKGDTITQFTPGVPLTFPGGQNIMGPASYGVDGESGWFWNTYIFAIIHDHSGMVGTWTAMQEARVMNDGTWWIPGNPDSVVRDPNPPVEFVDAAHESPHPEWQYRSSDILAWIDAPGPLLPRRLRPYDLTKTFKFLSWVELGGKRMCSVSWTVKLEWRKGVLMKWEFQK